MPPEPAWDATLKELKLQLTKSTFATWLHDAQLLRVDDGVYVIGVRNDFAKDWLENRLQDTIRRTLAAVTGRDVNVRFEVRSPSQSAQTDESNGANHGGNEEPPFPGFEPFHSNFTQVPKQFFEVVVPAGPPSLVAFIAAVINQTIGEIVNYHTGERKEWWEASYAEIAQVSSISRGSVVKVVRLSIERGYVVRKENGNSFKYRLRRLHEPVSASD